MNSVLRNTSASKKFRSIDSQQKVQAVGRDFVRLALLTEDGTPRMEQVYLLALALDHAGLEWMSGESVVNQDGSIGLVMEFWREGLPLYAMGERIVVTYNYEAVVRGVWRDSVMREHGVSDHVRSRSVSWPTIRMGYLLEQRLGSPPQGSCMPDVKELPRSGSVASTLVPTALPRNRDRRWPLSPPSRRSGTAELGVRPRSPTAVTIRP